MKKSGQILLTCEHASNRLPAGFEPCFSESSEVLETHRGYDLGIWPIARKLQEMLDCELIAYPYTRLLVDPNRSRPKTMFSEFSKNLPEEKKQILIQRYYQPYREKVFSAIQKLAAGKKTLLHLSMHSFTGYLNGKTRNADVGLLYDPVRGREKQYAGDLQAELKKTTGLRIRRNYPYLGKSDGVTSWLRKHFSEARYAGLEIEFNQDFLLHGDKKELQKILQVLIELI